MARTAVQNSSAIWVSPSRLIAMNGHPSTASAWRETENEPTDSQFERLSPQSAINDSIPPTERIRNVNAATLSNSGHRDRRRATPSNRGQSAASIVIGGLSRKNVAHRWIDIGSLRTASRPASRHSATARANRTLPRRMIQVLRLIKRTTASVGCETSSR